MEHILHSIVSLLKLPFVAAIKSIFTFLNLIPLKVYEFHGMGGYTHLNRPDIREQRSVALGDRVHLGTFIIAYARGGVKKKFTGNGQLWTGVWTENYRDIQAKWVW